MDNPNLSLGSIHKWVAFSPHGTVVVHMGQRLSLINPPFPVCCLEQQCPYGGLINGTLDTCCHCCRIKPKLKITLIGFALLSQGPEK